MVRSRGVLSGFYAGAMCFLHQIAESYRGSNFFQRRKTDLRDWGPVLGGMLFWVLVEVLLCELDGRVLKGVQFGVLVEVLFCEGARGHAVSGVGGGVVLGAGGGAVGR